MPSWLKCQDCGQKYYTATTIRTEKVEDECEKCGGDLVVITDKEHSTT